MSAPILPVFVGKSPYFGGANRQLYSRNPWIRHRLRHFDAASKDWSRYLLIEYQRRRNFDDTQWRSENIDGKHDLTCKTAYSIASDGSEFRRAVAVDGAAIFDGE
jgi:hypothetical protein